MKTDNIKKGFFEKNFQKDLEKLLEGIKNQDKVPRLLLHSCCAPCSSYVIAYLSDYFKITVFYYNPNISEADEYNKRAEEQKRFILEYPAKYQVDYAKGPYEPFSFHETVKGLESCEEGRERCFLCYEMRLEKTAQTASRERYDYFTTTLSVSPLKSSLKLNEIGYHLGKKYQVAYLLSDFKKKEGYKRSIELSKQYQLYRQNYCGCIYSKDKQQKAAQEQGK